MEYARLFFANLRHELRLFHVRCCALGIAIDISLCLRAVPHSEAWMKRTFPDLEEIPAGEHYNERLLSGKYKPARILRNVEEALNYHREFGFTTSLDSQEIPTIYKVL